MTTDQMTEDEAYRFGFLLRCAREGIDPGGAAALAAGTAKRATWGDVASTVAGWTPILGGGALLAGTVGLPMLGGYAAGRAADTLTESNLTPEDVRRRELIATLDGATERANTKSLRMQQTAARPLPRVYGA